MKEFDQAALAAMQNMDVRSIDPNTVADIAAVQVDAALPPEERLAQTIRQMNGNPYFFRCGNVVVKTSFQGTASLQKLLEDCLSSPTLT